MPGKWDVWVLPSCLASLLWWLVAHGGIRNPREPEGRDRKQKVLVGVVTKVDTGAKFKESHFPSEVMTSTAIWKNKGTEARCSEYWPLGNRGVGSMDGFPHVGPLPAGQGLGPSNMP